MGQERLYVENRAEWEAVCRTRRLSGRALRVREVSGGILLPPRLAHVQKGEWRGGVCDSGLRFVAGLLRGRPPACGYYGVGDSYAVAREDVLRREEDVIFGGVLIGHFGHFLLECLGRLWYVLQQRPAGRRIAFLVVLQEREWFSEFFRLLNLSPEDVLLVRRPTQFRSVLVPDEAVHSWYDYTAEYLLPYRYMVQKAEREAGREALPAKLFLKRSRLRATTTYCCNEAYFERFFVKRGFRAVAMEELSLARQIALISHATAVVSVLGSLSHWALFCRPGTQFIMLARTSTDTLATQCLVNEASGVDWRIVDVSMSFLYAHRSFGICLLGPTAHWKQFVLDAFGEVEEDESWKYAYHEYLLLWSDYYLSPANAAAVRQRDFYEVLRDMNRALYRNEPLAAMIEKRLGRPFLVYGARLLREAEWLPTVMEEYTCGDVEAPEGMAAFKLQFSSPLARLRYAVYSPDGGWGRERADGEAAEVCREDGSPLPLYGLEISLEQEGSFPYALQFRVHGCGARWSGWAESGQNIVSRDAPINAVEVRLRPLLQGITD